MSDLDLAYASATKLAGMIREGRISSAEAVGNALARIGEVNGVLNCFCFVYGEEALDLARAADQRLARGAADGPLHGVPIAIKDFTPMKGKRTTQGSLILEHWVPDDDPIIVARLRAAGAIVIGKTTTPEFAHSSFTESALWGLTRNPWDLGRTPGGSSGGAGAAVSAGCVALAEGSDMGGCGRTQWLHVASSAGLTFYRVSAGRGSLLDGVAGIVVHDHWKPYFTMQGVDHALCNAHHLRELQALIEIEKEGWARKMQRLLRPALMENPETLIARLRDA